MKSALAMWRAWWTGRLPRERRGLTVAATLVGLTVMWLWAIQPAWQTLRKAPIEQARLESQWLAMQRDAAIATSLRNAPPVSQAAATQALRDATDTLGVGGSLQLQGDRAVLTLKDVEGDNLRQWLTEVRQVARARPVEANLTHSAQGYNGTVVLMLGGRP